ALEYDNIRTAIRFGLDEDPELALRIVANIAFFVWLRGGFAETRAWVDEALEAGRDAAPMWRGRALPCGATGPERRGDLAAQTTFADDAYATASAAGDGFGMTAALRERGKAAIAAREIERARSLHEELAALAEEVGDDWNGAIALNNLGDLALYDGDWARTIDLCGLSSEIRFALGDRWGGALALSNVATAQIKSGDLDGATRSIGRALEESLAVDGRMVVQACIGIASLLASARHDQRRVAVLLG